MASTLSSLCGSFGPALIADYLRSEHGIGFFPDGPVRKKRELARLTADFIRGLPGELPRCVQAGLLQVKELCDPAGQEALRQVYDPGAWTRTFRDAQSAPQRALFSYLNHPGRFRTAELRKAHKAQRARPTSAAWFDCKAGVDPDCLTLSEAACARIEDALRQILGERILPGSEVLFDAAVLRDETGRKAEPVFQLGLIWCDATFGRRVRTGRASRVAMVDTDRMATITYFPERGHLAMTGNRIGAEGFLNLASIFCACILLQPHPVLPAAATVSFRTARRRGSNNAAI